MSHDEKNWYYHHQDKNHGPYTMEEFANRIKAGKVTASTYVWEEGMKNWEIAFKVASLRELLPSAPTKLPALPSVGGATVATAATAVAKASPEKTSAPKDYAVLKEIVLEEVAVKKSAHSIPKRPPKFQVRDEDFSALLELNPTEVEDRTEMMERGTLKSARREAAKVERKVWRANLAESFKRYKWVYFTIAAVVVVLGVAIQMNVFHR